MTSLINEIFVKDMLLNILLLVVVEVILPPWSSFEEHIQASKFRLLVYNLDVTIRHSHNTLLTCLHC